MLGRRGASGWLYPRHLLNYNSRPAAQSAESPSRRFWEVQMGKGDKRTTRGKIWRGSYGNSRPQGKPQPAGDKSKEKSR